MNVDNDARRYNIATICNILTMVYSSLQGEPHSLIEKQISRIITGGPEKDLIEQVWKVIRIRGPVSCLTEFPTQETYEKIAITELSKLMAVLFPLYPTSEIERDMKMFVTEYGHEGYHKAIADYLQRNIGESTCHVKNITFQELTEVLSLLPPRAPKELEVKLYRDTSGHLKMRFDGEIDVAHTAGRAIEE